MAQWVTVMLYKHEDLSLDISTHVRERGMAAASLTLTGCKDGCRSQRRALVDGQFKLQVQIDLVLKVR